MSTLKTNKEQVLEAYNNADDNGKKLLIDLYGAENFLIKITDRVLGYVSATNVLGIKIKTLEQFEELYDKDDARRQFARYKLTVMAKALNENWKPDFENESQYKYYNWMYNKKNGLVLDFSYTYDDCVIGSDLCLETRDKANHLAKIAKDEYATYIFGY